MFRFCDTINTKQTIMGKKGFFFFVKVIRKLVILYNNSHINSTSIHLLNCGNGVYYLVEGDNKEMVQM